MQGTLPAEYQSDDLHRFLPIDRWYALTHHHELADQAQGSILFADVPGFTPLTEAMAQVFGPQRGAEELTNQLNRVYTALIAPVHQYHGAVISFSGDSINCWFEGDDGRRAAAAGLAMQSVTADLEPFLPAGGLTFQPSIKVAIAVGPVRRFLAGDPAIQRLDVLAGTPLETLEKIGHLAERGLVVMEASAAAKLAAGGAGIITGGAREDLSGGMQAVILTGLEHPVSPDPWLEWKEHAAEQGPAKTEPAGRQEAADTLAEAWLLPAVQERLRTGRGRFLADLRPVTVLFLNFGGLDYDDENAGLLLDAYLRKVQHCLVRYEGAPLQLNTGDKGSYLYAAFGAPLAHDDDAARAVTAALELLQISTGMGFITGARVGIAQGVTFAGAYGSPSRQTYGLIGDKVNVAARLMQLAQPGEVLCDQEVYAQAQRHWDFETLAPVQIKGKASPIAIYRPIQRRQTTVQTVAGQTGRLPPLVGRQAEVDQLNALLDALQAAKSSVLFIEGEAGIGKSRLAAALLEMVKDRGQAVLLGSGQSIEQNVPYRAWRDVFQGFFDINDNDSLAVRQEKVQRAAEAAVPRTLQRLPLLNDVLSVGLPETQLTAILDPKLRRESLFNLLIALLRARIQTGPLVLVLEDVQWMDLLSWELAQHMVRIMRLEENPFLLVLANRPLDETHPAIKAYQSLRAQPASSIISLEALPETALAALIAGRLGISTGHLPPKVLQFVQTRSEGNPFFAEELIQAMRDRGLITLEPGEDGLLCRAHPALAQAGQALPATLHGLILSRIDRLLPEQQLTIKVAAVIGRTFAYSPLRDTLTQFVPVADAALKEHLSVLVHRELTLLEIPEPELTYIFKHVITQEAAYQSLLYAQRKEVHLAVARWYEALLQVDESKAPSLLPLLAYHYQQAGDVERERFYAHKAGEAATQAFANDSALAYLTRALELTPPEDLEAIFALRKLRRGIYGLQGNHAANLEEINQLLKIAEQLGSQEKQANILISLSRLYNEQGQYEAAEETARQAKALAQQTQNKELQIQSQVEMGYILSRRALYHEALQELEPALEQARTFGLTDKEGDLLHQIGVVMYIIGNRAQSLNYFQQCLLNRRMTGNRLGEGTALTNLGVYWEQGNLTAAREYHLQSLAIMREIGARSFEVYPLANISTVLYRQRRYEEAIFYGQQALTLARELNQPYVEAATHGCLGGDYLATGNFKLALSAYEQGLAIAQAMDDRQEEANELENIAWVYIRFGDFQSADSYLEKSFRQCQEIGDRETEAYLERDQAVQLLELGNLEQALTHCERGLAIAQELEMVTDREMYLILQGEIYLQQNQIDQAAASYQEAQKIILEAGNPAEEAAAGLIRVDLARGDTAQAAGRAAEILAYLENDTVMDAQNPAGIYLACYQAYQTAGDPRCAEVLAKGYDFIQSQARSLTDEQREMYFENVPSNKALLSLWMSQQSGADAQEKAKQ